MKLKQIGLSLAAAATVAFAAPMTPALAEMPGQPVQLAQTTIERERTLTGAPGDVEIKERDGLITRETEIDNDGTVDDNDTEYAGFSLMTWIVLGLIALAVAGYFMSRRHRVPMAR